MELVQVSNDRAPDRVVLGKNLTAAFLLQDLARRVGTKRCGVALVDARVIVGDLFVVIYCVRSARGQVQRVGLDVEHWRLLNFNARERCEVGACGSRLAVGFDDFQRGLRQDLLLQLVLCLPK